MPLLVTALVPAAPALLPGLTGGRAPELAAVRAAVTEVVATMAGLDRVVVVASRVPGTLAGFGAPSAPRGVVPSGSWPHELADALLDPATGARPDGPGREQQDWEDVLDTGWQALLDRLEAGADRVGLLLLADGSRTRGARAPGGQDPRGDAVDAELLAALREGRAPDVPDAGAVGATAGPAVALLAAAPGAGTRVLHHGAPLGVCYLVALRR